MGHDGASPIPRPHLPTPQPRACRDQRRVGRDANIPRRIRKLSVPIRPAGNRAELEHELARWDDTIHDLEEARIRPSRRSSPSKETSSVSSSMPPCRTGASSFPLGQRATDSTVSWRRTTHSVFKVTAPTLPAVAFRADNSTGSCKRKQRVPAVGYHPRLWEGTAHQRGSCHLLGRVSHGEPHCTGLRQRHLPGHHGQQFTLWWESDRRTRPYSQTINIVVVRK